jgi:hypothetical protein
MPLSLGYGLGVNQSRPGAGYDSDASALFARMAVQPSDAEKLAYSNLITALKACGAWALRQSYVSLWSHTAQAALLNLKGTSFTPSIAGDAPTFVVNQGYSTDGSNDSISTGWACTDAPQDAVSVDFWFHNSAASAVLPTGNGTNTRFNPRTSGTDFPSGRLNGGVTANGTVASGAGLSGMQRTSSTILQYWKDGAQVGTDVISASSAPTSAPLLLGANGAAFVANRFGFMR